jgi:hypothetical protein
MRVVQVIPSVGDSFYCENCLRDVGLVSALRKQGHEVLMLPMYLPVDLDEDEPSVQTPIFFGGINVYLQQKSAFFRKTPRWIDRLFDSPALLRWVGRKSNMTRASDLGRMTISLMWCFFPTFCWPVWLAASGKRLAYPFCACFRTKMGFSMC